jgi:hypothetical protein
MKNQNNKVTAVLFVVALALAPMVQAAIEPQGGPSVSNRNAPKARKHPSQTARPYRLANTGTDQASDQSGGSLAANLPVIEVFATDNVSRGKTGTFVLSMKPALMLGGTWVNFSLSGTAINGVDYKLVTSPAYISQTGFGTIQIETLADPRGSAFNQAYSVVVTLTAGAGYSIGKSSQAIMWIKPAAFIPPNS